MAHGSRGRWMRITTAGFGVLLSTTLVGCLNWDKSKDTKGTGKQPTPTPGLYGTPKLDGNGQLPGVSGAYKGPGSNLPATAYQPGGPGTYRPTSNGINTNTGNPVQPIDYRPQLGGGTPFAAPGQPGVVNTGGTLYPQPNYSGGPPAPSLPLGDITPPNPPYSAPASGGFGVGMGPIEPPLPGFGTPGKP